MSNILKVYSCISNGGFAGILTPGFHNWICILLPAGIFTTVCLAVVRFFEDKYPGYFGAMKGSMDMDNVGDESVNERGDVPHSSEAGSGSGGEGKGTR
jgi:hypothetical protein